jgi:tryptophan synthase alpha chain
VVVGFGISTPAHVRTVCALTDGVVVGSALVRRTLDDKPFPALLADFKAFAAPLIAPTKETWN